MHVVLGIAHMAMDTPTNPIDISTALTELSNEVTNNAATLAGVLGLGVVVRWAPKLFRRFAR